MRKQTYAVLGILVLLASVASVAVAQQAEPKQELPAGWTVRVDRANAAAAEVKFWNMAPGWHATTGPAAILYNPANAALGEYRLESESFLFPGEHAEGFGVFFGGKDLALPAQSYVYFLIRKDGQFIVKAREGAATRTLIPWTAHAAIVPHDGSKETAKNVLAVQVGKENVDFFVNGQQVGSLPRAQLSTDGIVGLRINHHLNVHVTTLTVESAAGKQEFAPKRPAKP
ncbi:MAG: hypothetical protein ACRD2Y_17130 [Terriglobales bacterium]